MEGAVIGTGGALLVAILGAAWRLSSQMQGVRTAVADLRERLDRADLEGIRDRVTRLEARCPQCVEDHR